MVQEATIDGFITWLGEQDPDASIDHFNFRNCAIGQYLIYCDPDARYNVSMRGLDFRELIQHYMRDLGWYETQYKTYGHLKAALEKGYVPWYDKVWRAIKEFFCP